MRRGCDVTIALAALVPALAAAAQPPCDKPVYLTFDTGHMAVAPLVADVLARQGVKATFFLANERTKDGGSSLDDQWAPWWKARAAEGHAFGSHTWDHDVWLADTPAGLRVKPTMGAGAGKPRVLDATAYCNELERPAQRFQAMTGQPMGRWFRAPGGKTSPALLAAASRCGWTHVGWASAGFLGDELPSDRFPNAQLLDKALRDIRPGDILVAHLGIWSRQDPWAPAALEPLIKGLKAQGFCFATLRDHPQLAGGGGAMIGSLLDTLSNAFGDVQQWLFEQVVQPLMFNTGLGNLLAEGYRATGWLLVGLLQIAVMLTLFRALERWRPVEAVTDRAAVRVDVIYTLIHRLGLVRVALFFTVDPLWDLVVGKLRVWGLPTFSLDALWPGVTDVALVSFVLYLLLFDLVDYALHRAQHHFDWWWQLHAVHHSQRQMTMWSDNRNHLLDDLIRDTVFVGVALAVGIAPSQFVAVVALTQLVESFSHANVRLSFGPWLSRVLVGPQFHRLHHRVGLGHESAGAGTLGGHNFAVLFPLWDLLFRTARYDGRYEPTGIRDQLPVPGGRDYGRGFWAQQWLGLKRLAGQG